MARQKRYRDTVVRKSETRWNEQARCHTDWPGGGQIDPASPTQPWPTPNRLWLAAGAAEGTTELNAFDNALLDGGIGNLNLIKVSSVVPAGGRVLAGTATDHAGIARADRLLGHAAATPPARRSARRWVSESGERATE